MMDAQSKLNFELRPAERSQKLCCFYAFGAGMKISLSASFVFVVFVAFHNNQIGWIVVATVAILVMHNLIVFERSTKHLFGNYPVFILKAFAHPGNYLVSAMGNMSAFPVWMIRAIKTLYILATYSRIAALCHAPCAESLKTKRTVFLRSHIVNGFQMTGRNLCLAKFAA